MLGLFQLISAAATEQLLAEAAAASVEPRYAKTGRSHPQKSPVLSQKSPILSRNETCGYLLGAGAP